MTLPLHQTPVRRCRKCCHNGPFHAVYEEMDKQCQLVGRLEVSGIGVLPWVGPGEDKSNQQHFLTDSGFFSRQFSEIQAFVEG